MSRLSPSLHRTLAGFLLALAAPGALVWTVAIGDDEPPAAETAKPADSAEPEDAAAAPDDTSIQPPGLPGFEPSGEGTEPATKPADPKADDAAPQAPAPNGDDSIDFGNGADDETAAPTTEPEKPTAKVAPPAADPQQQPPPPGPHKPSAAPRPLAGGSAKPLPAGKYVLAYKFKPDEVVRWEVVHRAVVDTTIQGTNQTAETRSTSIKAWQVDEVMPDGSVTLVHLVESIDMWQKMQGRQEVRYNSRTDEKVPPGYEDIAKAVGVPLTVVTIDAHGTVLKREEKHRQSNASNMPLAIPLPVEPVAVGHVWSVPADVEVILHGGATRKIQTRQKFVLENVADGLATIAMETQVLTPINDPAIEAQLVQRYTNGTLKFDLERGRVVSQQLDLDRRVVGFSGTSSSMHYLTRFTEELLTDGSPVALKKPAPKPPTAAATRPVAKPTPPPATAKGPKPRARPAQR